MMYEELIQEIRGVAVETGSLVCLGCGHEHNCGIHGCAILREVAERYTAKDKQLAEATNDLKQCGSDSGTICGFCLREGACEISEDDFDGKWPDCFEWRGPQEAGEGEV